MGKILRDAQEVRKPAVLTRSLVAMSIAAFSSLHSLAQESPEQAVVIQVPPEAVQAVPAQSAEQAKPVASAGKTPEEKRLEELLKLKIDRTPASILKAKAKLQSGAPNDNPIETFRLNLVAGNWKGAGAFLKNLSEKDAVKVYEFVLKELDKAPAANPGQPQQQSGPAPTPTLQAEEIADLADIAPTPLNKEQIKLLASLLKRVLAANEFTGTLVQRLEQGTSQLGGKDPAKRELAGLLFIESGRNVEALKFLPPLLPGQESKSFDLTEKHVRAIFSLGRQEQKPEAIRQAWPLNQTLLAAPDCPREIKERAWRRYADIVRFLPPDFSTQELKKVFQQQPDNGLTLLKEIGTQVGDDRANRNITVRKANLEMQRNAVEALLPVAERRAQWQPALDLFTLNWAEEADYAKRLHTPPRPQGMQYDPYGNPIYYGNQPQPVQQTNPNQLPPIPLAEVLTIAPGEEWLKAVDPSLRSRVLTLVAESYLKLEEDEKALPYIEKLAALEPKEALKLSNELLRVWATTHDPMRASGQRRSSVMTSSGSIVYYSSGQQQAIPLTRALQQRNLEELSALLQRLRALPIDSLDNAAVVAAFTAAHSQAEVFRGESIKLVFGEVEQIKPETLAEMLQTMRQRLAGQWRKPNVQQMAKTQRTDAQIDAEVLNGYELLSGLVQKGLERQPDDWRLNLVQAAMWFDWAEFQYGKKVDLAIYVEKRERSFAAFQRAAELYAARVPSLEQKDETPQVYQQWLNANLGASDLALVTRQQEPSEKNLERIRTAILSLPGEAAQRHLDALAKAVAEGTGSLPAHLKPSYMRAALSIVKDRPDAEKIRDLVTYYDGLLREIELSVRVDGDATVGHEAPFGIFLTVHHTAALERENAGGFSKYLRNQSQMPYYYNPYGVAPIDYKDELEKQMREKLSEGFEILSITFHDEKVQSRGYGRQGWRETPLVYALVKAKDASVDRIPSLRLDADFVDKYGPVVLPVQSPVLLIDAKGSAPARPSKGMEITHTLDDRTAKEGKITLEVKATANGLIPKFDELFDFTPAAFKIEEFTDSGPAVQRLSSEGEELAAVTERNWVIKLSHEPSSTGTEAFQFPKPKTADLKVAYKRYQDADLVEVAPDVALAGMPLNPNRMWPWMVLGTVVVVTAVVVPMRLRRQSAPVAAGITYSVPSTVTPFTTLQLLRQMYADEHLALPVEQRGELARDIAQVESYYFAPSRGEAAAAAAPDLDAVASTWVTRAGGVRS